MNEMLDTTMAAAPETTGMQDAELSIDDTEGYWDEEEADQAGADATPEDDAANGDAEEPTGDAEPGADEEKQPEAKTAEQAAEEPLHKVKFYGREYELPESELVAMAQKGMNYDNMVQRYERQLAESKPMQVLHKYAERSGMDIEGYVDYLERNIADQEVQRMVEGGMTEEAARQYQQMERQRQQMQSQQAAEQARRAQQEAYLPLVERYPDVKQLPGEVMQMIGMGAPPLFAYETWMKDQELARIKGELEKTKNTQAAKQADEKNRKSAPGSAKGVGSGPAPDLFEQGWNDI